MSSQIAIRPQFRRQRRKHSQHGAGSKNNEFAYGCARPAPSANSLTSSTIFARSVTGTIP